MSVSWVSSFPSQVRRVVLRPHCALALSSLLLKAEMTKLSGMGARTLRSLLKGAVLKHSE